MLKKFWVILLVSFSNVYPQFVNDSLIYSPNYYNTNSMSSSYSKQLNTHNLLSNITYSVDFNNIFFGMNNTFNSTVIKSRAKNIRDEEYLSLLGQYKFSEIIEAGFNLRQNSFADDRSLAINKSTLGYATIFGNFYPQQNIKITPFWGFADNSQIGLEDKGTVYGASGKVTDFKLSDFNLNADFGTKTEDINRRNNTNYSYALSVENSLENNLTNKINGMYTEASKDFYFETDSLTSTKFNISKNIQTRIEKKYIVSDQIHFSPGNSPFSFNAEAQVSWRNIDRNTKYILVENINSSSFDSKIEEFKLNFLSSFSYITNNLSSIVQLIYAEQEEKHNAKFLQGASQSIFTKRQDTEAQKNNSAQQTTISSLLRYKFSQSDIISFSMFHRKLVYNTPSENNFDDRDELLSIISLSYNKKISPFFNMYINLEGSFNKIVYIFSERSSNNNVQRTLKLSSGGTFKGSKLISRNDFEVSANYTAYDFTDLNPNLKSFAFRQFAYKDSTRINLTRSVDATFYGYVKLSEQGDFIWKSFKGKPVRYLQEIYIEPKMEYRYKQLAFGTGVRYFSLNTFKFNENSKLISDSKYSSIGPISSIKYFVQKSIVVSCTGWFEFITNETQTKREMANLFIDVKWNI